MTRCIIYDFETFGQDFRLAPIISFAGLEFDLDTLNEKSYNDLLLSVKMIKFDVKDQIDNYSKKVCRDTINWWREQNKEAQKRTLPSKEDKPISEFYTWILDNFAHPMGYEKVFTRGNTFDPMFLDQILKDIGKETPFNWWAIRDTRSYLEGLAFGIKSFDNKFIPEEYKDRFIEHHPAHDIVMDVIRIKVLQEALT